MTLERIIALCKAYDRLGTSVQEQLSDILDGRIDDCNPNAVKLCRVWLCEAKEHADVNGDDELREDVETALDDIDDRMKEDR